MEEYSTFFEQATGRTHYDYQKHLACGERSGGKWLNQGGPCVSRLIDVPTGLGKTAAVVMAWLWNRVILGRNDWPCRLVYCLPMRTLVEQTEDNVNQWLEKLAPRLPENPDLQHLSSHSPVVLMGGEELNRSKREWDIHPEKPAVLIGTQDMLLSRALNRGYGMSRFRWPMHFALLNNDCLWILDETQLMGSGLWTTAQLDWMRQDRFQSFKPCVSWWMSATLGGEFLKTQDRSVAKIPAPEIASLSPEEESSLEILKAVRPVTIYPDPKGKMGKQDRTEFYFHRLSQSIVNEHLAGRLTLAVCNRVAHAQSLKKAIEKHTGAELSNGDVLLLTSRFRLKDRKAALEKVVAFEEARKKGHPHPGLILVSTQVIEAGFDVSAARLWTEAAPWPSFVQRLGRLNRDGKLNGDAKAFVFEVPAQQRDSGPYDEEDLKTGKEIVSALKELCAEKPDLPARQAFAELKEKPNVAKIIRQALEPKPEPFPRASDVHGLFSTEPDVFGGFTDISPWVRNIEKTADVTVFWRKFDPDREDPNSGEGQGLQRDELCPVSVWRLQQFLKDSRKAWFWEPKKKCWEAMRPADLCPGMTIMLPAACGGYETALGWTGDPQSRIDEDIPPPGPFEDKEDEDRESITGNWVSLETHLSDTRNAAERISASLNLQEAESKCLLRAAELHDIGKSLDRWQGKLPHPCPQEGELYAKSPHELVVDVTDLSEEAKNKCTELVRNDLGQEIFKTDLKGAATPPLEKLHMQIFRKPKPGTADELSKITGKHPKVTSFRPGFRHEVASALAMWRQYYRNEAPPDFPALTVYIVAAHHGKVRTVLGANPHVAEPNVCGIPIDDSTALPWNPAWTLDFEAANDGASGEFDADGTFIFKAPGWSGLVADLLGGWEKNAPKRTCGAVGENEPHSLGPFALAYFETLLRAADGRSSAQPSQTLKHG